MSKLRWEHDHAKLRARQRLGLDMNKYALREIRERIEAGRLPLVRRQSLRVSVYRDVLNGVDTDIVYDRKRRSVVTFLPVEKGVENGQA